MKFLFKHRRLIFAVLLLAVVAILFPHVRELPVAELLDHAESPVVAALILIGLFCVKSVLFVIPLVALYIGAGVLFPVGWALAVVCAGLVCELLLAYWLGCYLAADWITEHVKKSAHAAKLLNTASRKKGTVCFLARLLPLPLPFDIVSMFLGANKIPLRVYLPLSLLGLCPTMIPWVVAGGAIATPLSAEFLVPFGISIAVMAVSFLVYRKISSRGSPPDELAT